MGLKNVKWFNWHYVKFSSQKKRLKAQESEAGENNETWTAKSNIK